MKERPCVIRFTCALCSIFHISGGAQEAIQAAQEVAVEAHEGQEVAQGVAVHAALEAAAEACESHRANGNAGKGDRQTSCQANDPLHSPNSTAANTRLREAVPHSASRQFAAALKVPKRLWPPKP
jgi:hypothetical protein